MTKPMAKQNCEFNTLSFKQYVFRRQFMLKKVLNQEKIPGLI